eukprot:TRINITY_DN33188_c0_g1_i1.p1 TRINITY_DN33188_c0_g1~~TRINITY_DN33188_c0_g1_i1.p1  ORF type:complete len:232 (-),score=26.81 TRINITY_DN33188_c0_g1_i1:48-695(-)
MAPAPTAAAGLRLITNATYEPYGSGRDWFFIGDFSYRHGRRTPDPNLRHKMADPVKYRPRGQPREVAINDGFTLNLKHPLVSEGAMERWKKHAESETVNDVIQARLSSSRGQNVSMWRAQSATERTSLGSKYGKLRPARPPPAPKRGDARTKSLYGGRYTSLPEHAFDELHTARDFGAIPGWQHPEFGSPDKHMWNSMPCFPKHRYMPNEPECPL